MASIATVFWWSPWQGHRRTSHLDPEARTSYPPLVTLRCVECHATTTTGRRWRAYLTVDRLVAIFCPACAAREFG